MHIAKLQTVTLFRLVLTVNTQLLDRQNKLIVQLIFLHFYVMLEYLIVTAHIFAWYC